MCLILVSMYLWSVGDLIVTEIGSNNLQILGLLKPIMDHGFRNAIKVFGDLIHDVMHSRINLFSTEIFFITTIVLRISIDCTLE